MSRSKCQELRDQITTLNNIVKTNTALIKGKQEQIEAMWLRFLRTDDEALEAEIEKLKKEIETIEQQTTRINSQLTDLTNQWNSSGLTCVDTRPPCLGPNDRVLSIPFVEIRGPEITHNTNDLFNRKQELINARDRKLQPIEECLHPENGIRPLIDKLLNGDTNIAHPTPGSRPLIDYCIGNRTLNPPLTKPKKGSNGLLFQYIMTTLGQCVSKTDGGSVPELLTKFRPGLEKILTDDKNWTTKTPGGLLRDEAAESIIALVNNIIPELEAKAKNIKDTYNPRIDKIQDEINELSNPESETNKKVSEAILDIIKQIKDDAPKPDIYCSTTVTAPGGPGLDRPNPCDQTVSITIQTSPGQNDDVVVFDSKSYCIVLAKEGIVAYNRLGAGGCKGENPIWRHPVTIKTSGISIPNIAQIKTYLINKLLANKKVQEFQNRESTSEPGVKTPLIDLSNINPFTDFDNRKFLQTCIESP